MRECLLRTLNFSAASLAMLVCGMHARMCQMATCGNVKSGVEFSVRFSVEKVLAQMYHFRNSSASYEDPTSPLES